MGLWEAGVPGALGAGALGLVCGGPRGRQWVVSVVVFSRRFSVLKGVWKHQNGYVSRLLLDVFDGF